MKIKRYENLILEIEKLAKNPEENAEKLKELTGVLADQQAYFETVSVKKIGEKINSGSLSAKQYMILKSLLVEKKFYEKNSKKIDAVIAGDYKIFNKTKKVTFRRIIKATGVIAAAALLTLGLTTCKKKQQKHNDKVKNDVVTEEITEDNNKDIVSDITTEAVKENDNTKDTAEENIEAKESSKDNKDDKKDSKKEDESTETKEENKNNDVTVNNNTGKPETTTTTTQNTASSSTSNSYSNRETSTIVPVKPENVQTNGKLPIEPTTIVVDNTSNEPVNNDNKVIPADKPVPSTNNVDANTKDETTNNIPSNSSTEPAYNGKDENKTDSYSEEPSKTDLPSINKIEESGSDSEITHDIPDNSSHEPAYNGEEEDKPNNILNIIDAPTNVPTLDNNHIKDDGTEFIINNINFVNTIENYETPSYSNDTPSFDNVEDDGTEIIINDYSNGNNVISLEDDNKVDSYSEETIGNLPSFDNVEEDETMDVDVKGYTYTLSFPGMTL